MQKINLNKYFSNNEIYLIAGVFAFVLSVFIFTFFSPNYYESDEPIELIIPRGATLNQVIDSLYSKKVIKGKFNIKVAAFIYGADKKIKAGKYKIPNGLSYLDLIELFIDASQATQIRVTIPEGIWMKDLASLLQKELNIDSAKVMELSRSRSFLRSLGLDENINSLQGYLLPETYYFYPASEAEEILRKLKSEMDTLFNKPEVQKRMKELGMNKHEILTLASIIDAESNNFSEFKTISGVYHNRLKRGMLLQADPTVQFLIRHRKNKKVYYKDLEIDSRYNTYKYPGLPPGPINNPGKDAIMAALYPEKHNYYYFVADGNGGHKFASTPSEHEQNVLEYRQWRRSQNN
ncbi:endolytic transglycosylase MltG [Melioribacter sp. OK-6-Me]|uniref:endolytic transglycosylase MltG n=1 Tax=unclassified Melioribacter TaxID=2627329 RepID=UPI003EDAAFD1